MRIPPTTVITHEFILHELNLECNNYVRTNIEILLHIFEIYRDISFGEKYFTVYSSCRLVCVRNFLYIFKYPLFRFGFDLKMLVKKYLSKVLTIFGSSPFLLSLNFDFERPPEVNCGSFLFSCQSIKMRCLYIHDFGW